MNEPKLTYARNQNGDLVFIDTVPKGKKCNCVCDGCGKPLIAKQGDKNQHHFAHEGGNIRECYDKTLHSLAEQIITEYKQVFSPEYKGEYYSHVSELLSFAVVEVEQRNDSSDLQPDLVGVTKDGKRILIEIYKTHKVDEEKKDKIRKRGLTCMQINVSNCSLDREELKTFLLTTDKEREWINHPEFDERNKQQQEFYQNQSEENRQTFQGEDYIGENEDIFDWGEPKIGEQAYDSQVSAYIELHKEEAIIANDVEPPTIIHNEELVPTLDKLNEDKENIVSDRIGNSYYIEMKEPTYSGNFIVARVFDRNYKTSRQAAHIVLIDKDGYICEEIGRESGEQLYSRRYTYARKKY